MTNEEQQKRAIALMIAYQSGEIEAFEALYQLLQPTLLQYLLYKAFDRFLAEDLLQESFLQMHRSRGTYTPGRAVMPWAIAIARNVYLMHSRARRRRARHEVDGASLPDLPLTAEFEHMAERQNVCQAISRLKPDQREILLMHHVWGLSFQEIGGILGIRRGAAKLRAHRAVKTLRLILGVTGETG
jgi:RNA polymerase sigma-70 factor (ECF subfamily)